MAIVYICGFEQLASSGDKEDSTSASLFADEGWTSDIRSGQYSLRTVVGTGSAAYYTVRTAGFSYYVQFYIKVASRPSSARRIWGNVGTGNINLRLNSNGTVAFYVDTTLIGTSTTALTDTAKWYRIAIRAVNGTSVPVLKIDNNTEVTGSPSSWVGLLTFGCTDNIAGGFTVYYDDCVVDNADWPDDNKVVALVPVSDNAPGTWATGNGNTSDLFDAVDNNPAAGVASANETAFSNIECATNSATANCDFNLTTYTDAGIGASDTVNAVQAWLSHGEDVSTGTKSGAIKVVSNPAQTDEDTFTYGNDGGAHGDELGYWYVSRGTAQAASGVTKGTSPVLRVGKRTATNRTVCVDGMSLYVAYTPAATAASPNVNDTPPATESVTLILSGLKVNVNDTVQVTEERTPILSGMKVNVGDTVQNAEQVTPKLSGVKVNVNDTVQQTETVTGILSGLKVSVADTVANEEAITLDGPTIPSVPTPSVVDDPSVVENVVVVLSGLKVVTDDTVQNTESVTGKFSGILLNASDTNQITESVTSVLSGIKVNAGDTVANEESVTGKLSGLKVDVNDTVGNTESVTGKLSGLKVDINDTNQVTESVTGKLSGLKVDTNDTIQNQDSPTGKLSGLKVNINDAVQNEESVTGKLSGLKVDVNDAVQNTESVVGILSGLKVAVNDTVQNEESITLDGPVAIGPPSPNVTDAPPVVENVTLVLSALKVDVSDAVGNTESVTEIMSGLKIDVNDTVQNQDSITGKLSGLKVDTSDTVGNTESVIGKLSALKVDVADTVQNTENVTSKMSGLQVSVTDTVGNTDVVLSVILSGLKISVGDTNQITEDTTRVISGLKVNTDDQVQTTEYVDRAFSEVITASPNVSDTVPNADIATLALSGLKVSVNDSVTVEEYVEKNFSQFDIEAGDDVVIGEVVTLRRSIDPGDATVRSLVYDNSTNTWVWRQITVTDYTIT